MIELYTSWIAAAALSAIALIHVYWAGGGFFPGTDPDSLARTVVGGRSGMRMPSSLACLVVAGLLLVAAWLVLTLGGAAPMVLTPGLHHLAGYGLFVVLFLRGVGGFLETRLRPEIVGSPYEKLNLVVYSPLCLALAALILFVLQGA